MKYAEANTIVIGFVSSSQVLTMTISDNGKGFQHSSEPTLGGKGHQNIQYRVKKLGGQFNIHSDAHGTKITVEIPL